MVLKKLKRVVIKEEFVALTNNVTEAIILNQMIYWLERAKDFDMFIEQEKKIAKSNRQNISIEKSAGWVYKTAEELSEETMLRISVQNMRLHIKKLIALGYLDERNNPKYKWDKTKQYRVNLIKIQEDLNKLGYKLEGYYFEPSETNNAPEPAESSNSQIVNGVNKSEIHMNNSEVQSEQFVNAIPEITTEITTEIKKEKANGVKEQSQCDIPITSGSDTPTPQKGEPNPQEVTQNTKITTETSTIVLKKEKKKSFDEIIESYTDNEELRKALKDHLKIRKAHKALIDTAVEKSLIQLDEIAGNDEDKIKIVYDAIINGKPKFRPLTAKYNSKQTSYNIDKWETETNNDEYNNYLLGLI